MGIRYTPVTLAMPAHDSRFDQPPGMYAVSVMETNPPEAEAEPIAWLVLTSEPIELLDDVKKRDRLVLPALADRAVPQSPEDRLRGRS